MKVLLLIAACVAYAAAECSDMQRIKVKQQWSRLYADGQDRIAFNTAVYRRFFELKPAVVEMFTRVNGNNIYSGDFRAHMARVMAGVDMCLSLLDDKEVLTEQLAHLNTQHKAIAGSGDHIKEFGQALMEVVASQDVICFDQDAWSGCLKEIGTGMFS